MKTTWITQFTGRGFTAILVTLVLLDVVSFLTLHTALEPILFAAASVGLAVLAWKAPQWLLPLALAELLSTSNGHSLNLELAGASIGLRMVLFGLLLLASLYELYRSKQNVIPKPYRLIALLFLMLLLYGGLQGLLQGHPIRSLYLDANGYLAIGYVFAAWVLVRTAVQKQQLLQGLAAGMTWIIGKTLLFLFLFGHLHPKTLDPLYLWIRDTRLGEITLQRANIYRIFLQSQWFLLVGILGSASYLFFGEKQRETGVRLIWLTAVAALIASLSRSFWLALIVAGALLLGIALFKSTRQTVKRIGDLTVLLVGAIALLWVIVAVPIFQTAGSDLFGALLRDRATQTTEAALDSRRQLLTPMVDAVKSSPIAGYGLGKHLTYRTSDPRWIETNDTDIVSTYAFEWGWLDIWVKFGLVGVLLFALLGWQLLRDLYRATKTDPGRTWLYVTLGTSLVALYVTHLFTPYLNHPLGWALIALIVALLPRQAPVVAASPTPVTTPAAPILARTNE